MMNYSIAEISGENFAGLGVGNDKANRTTGPVSVIFQFPF